MAETGKKRGPYRKTSERKREITETALEVFAEQGYHRTSVREIAERTGLSQTGVLHHFGSKTELLEAVLAQRDVQDWTAFEDTATGLDYLLAMRSVMQHNAEVPNLIELFATLSAEATAKTHPAHEYFVGRYERTRALSTTAIKRAQADGDLPEWIDPAVAAALLVAVMDGLQVQWLYDPAVDMDAAMSTILALLTGKRP